MTFISRIAKRGVHVAEPGYPFRLTVFVASINPSVSRRSDRTLRPCTFHGGLVQRLNSIEVKSEWDIVSVSTRGGRSHYIGNLLVAKPSRTQEFSVNGVYFEVYPTFIFGIV